MKNDYLTVKPPFTALLIFALPIMLGKLFQQLYTMVDSAIVGRYVSQNALAAVGASGSLSHVFICVAIGGGVGASVIVSRYFGGKDFAKMKTAIFTSLFLFLGTSVVLAIVGLLTSRWIMAVLNTPAEAFDLAVVYLKIYFLGLPFLFLYNVISSMFNAMGKSRIPLYFLILSSLLNVGLDLFFVTRLNMGMAGAAWATLIAQSVSAVLSFIALLYELAKLEGAAPSKFDKNELRPMLKIALPSVLQQSTVSIGMMLVQSVVNSFGAEALAGFSAAGRIEGLCCVPMIGIGTAVSSYTAQNIGSKKLDRVVR